MSKFDNGVPFYTSGVAYVPIFFPCEELKCKWCSFCYAEPEIGRYRCRLTGRVVYAPNVDGLPEFCPIEFETKEV